VLQQQFDRSLTSECGSTMKGRFTSGSCISHEAAGFDTTFGDRVGVRTRRKQHFKDFVVWKAIGGAKGTMQRRFSRLTIRKIDVRSPLDQKLAQSPMAVEAGSVQIEISSKRRQWNTLRKKESDGTDVTVVRAPTQKRDTIVVLPVWSDACFDQLKHQVRAPVGELSQKCINVICHPDHQPNHCVSIPLQTPNVPLMEGPAGSLVVGNPEVSLSITLRGERRGTKAGHFLCGSLEMTYFAAFF
jgi:hypothetical protein